MCLFFFYKRIVQKVWSRGQDKAEFSTVMTDGYVQLPVTLIGHEIARPLTLFTQRKDI